jgi:hypothetical protein
MFAEVDGKENTWLRPYLHWSTAESSTPLRRRPNNPIHVLLVEAFTWTQGLSAEGGIRGHGFFSNVRASEVHFQELPFVGRS